nr:thermonuclease family protein [uncultured Sphingomonas sp.]
MPPTRAPSFRPRRRGVWRAIIIVPILLVIGALLDPALIKPRWILADNPQKVGDRFTLCGRGRSFACVTDGDSFKLGERKIRIAGIDAPELGGAQCPQEAAQGIRARDRLLVLLNQGNFTMTAHRLQRLDQYGRELMAVERGDHDIGQQLIDEGLAHRYIGHKTSWC